VGKPLGEIELGQDSGHAHEAGPVPGHFLAQLEKELVLFGLAPIRGAQELVLKDFEFLGDVAFGVDQGLAADEVGRRFSGHSLAQFEIIAENLGVSYLELGQVAGRAFTFEHGGQRRLAVVGQIHELVQGLVVTRSEQPAFGDDRRQGVGQGTREQAVHIVQVVPVAQQGGQLGWR
jgi:hypothetical protein